MRLNRNSVIFIALLAVVIVVAVIFLRDDGEGDTDQADIEATTEIVAIFPEVSGPAITSISITEVRELGDTRPTPIAGNPTLEPATPLPEGVEAETTTEILALTKDSETSTWVVGEATTQAVTGEINTALLTSGLELLSNLSSNQQFIPPNGDYSQYGLDNPTYDLQFEAQTLSGAGEATSYRLRIGDRTVGGSSYYAFLNDDSETVYVVTGANLLQSSLLNMASEVPLVPTLVPTEVPTLNVLTPFEGFVLTNASGFTFTNNETGDEVVITRNADNTEWVYTQNGEELVVEQEFLQIILNSFANVAGVDETDPSDLASLGLDEPSYRFEARTVDGSTYILQLGNEDPTGTIYYGLVNDFDTVVLIDSDTVALLQPIFENPPLLEPEMTPEATAEAMEATEEAEMTEEAEATEESE